MTDSEIIQQTLDHQRLSASEFASEIGLTSNQTIYNILKGKHGISRRLAKKITDKFPEISYDYLRGKSENIQNGGAGSVNIQGVSSKVKTGHIGNTKETEIKFLKEKIKTLEQQIEEYRAREKNLMKLLLKSGGENE